MKEDKTDSWNMVPQFDLADYHPPFISINSSDDLYLPIMRQGDFLSLLFKEGTPRKTVEKIYSLLCDHVAYIQLTGEKRSDIPPGLREQRQGHNGG